MKHSNLILALAYLQYNISLPITGIQFEDGSGYKFNYQLNGEWKYIDLTGKI